MKVQTHRIARLVTISLAAGALAAPAASARPAPADTPSAGGPVVIEPEPAPVIQSVDEGFDWGSAAIGAGGAGAQILLVSAGGITYRHRHEHVGIAR
jgi:hypothetical protein